jgi:hypothetical protein
MRGQFLGQNLSILSFKIMKFRQPRKKINKPQEPTIVEQITVWVILLAIIVWICFFWWGMFKLLF